MAIRRDKTGFSGLVSVFSLAGVFACAILYCGNHAYAQIIPDATLGNSSTITPNVNIKGLPADRIDGGAIRGANLFHSFREFNVKESGRVYFANPAGINNILTRVTGSNISYILGTLGVDGTANLFLLNPNGIVFGKNASLDVGKSFYATTASSIKFGEMGDFSATNPRLPSSLLTINPSAFFFNQRTNPASIVNQSRATQTLQGTPTDGLQVPNGQTLLLLGGNVTVDDGRLIARGGRVEIGAVAGTGSVGLNANGSLNFPDTIQRADVVFNNQASANRSGIDVRFANAGDIGITAGNISLFGGSQLRAGIASGFGSLDSQGGDLIVNATGEVRMTGEDTRMANDVRPNAIGKAGNIKVIGNSLVVTDGAQLSSSTFGIGDGGNVEIVADRVLFSGVRADELGASAAFSRVEEGAIGNGGTVQISTKTLEIRKGAILGAGTFGTGDGGNIIINAKDTVLIDGPSVVFTSSESDRTGKSGNIDITTDSLSVTNGAELDASTNGTGDAGSVTINAPKSIQILGFDPIDQFPSGVFSQTEGTGNAGSINLSTKQLFIEDGGVIQATTLGEGNAGNIKISTEKLLVRDTDPIAIAANTFGKGDAGNIFIDTGSMSVINTQVGSITIGKGNAGNLTIHATDSVEVSGKIKSMRRNIENPAGLFAQVNVTGEGNGGNLTIEARRLSISNGGKVQVATFGQGNAGNLLIRASEVEVFDTPSANLFATGINAGVEIDPDETEISPRGNGGDLTIETESLSVRNGATVSVATSGQGNAGRLRIRASKSVDVAGTSPNGKFKSQITAAVTPDGTGNGGSLQINTGKMIVRDGAEVTVSSVGTGFAGNLDIEARSISLDKQGSITAVTKSGNGGDMTLNLQELLLLRNGSQISTTAGSSQFGGNGGNIVINSRFIAAVPKENSDITANAFTGKGGRVDITTNGIFGIAPQERLTPFSNITASSEFGIQGFVTINTPDVDPSRGLVQLPTNLVDASQKIVQSCSAKGKIAGSFIATGRGGLPASPLEPLRGRAVITNWVTLPTATTNKITQETPEPQPIVEAQGWIKSDRGDVILVALSEQMYSHPATISCSQ